MNNKLYIHFLLLPIALCIGFDVNQIFGQLLPRQAYKEDKINKLTPQFETEENPSALKITKEMKDLLRYARTATNPMIRDRNTDKFISRYYPYFDTRLMRNGDIAYLKFYYEKYLKTLHDCIQIASFQSLEFEITRHEFFKKSTLESRKAKRIYWRQFDKKRNELIDNFLQFRQYVLPSLSTEIAMILQEIHFPKLAYAMNQLKNLDESPLEVSIYSNHTLSIPERKDSKIAGLSIISKCENIFTSGSPAIRNAYPGLRGSNKGLTVHLCLFENGVTLSHELGHLYYLYYKWDEYISYIQSKGKYYEPGGHGPDDPSGLAAKMTEQGKMPF